MLFRGRGGHLINLERSAFKSDNEYYKAIRAVKFTFINKDQSVPVEEKIAALVRKQVCM